MSKAVALCEVIVSGCGKFSLPHLETQEITMGQWAHLLKQSPQNLPADADAQEVFQNLLARLVALRNDFVHRAFNKRNHALFALTFLDHCEQFANSDVVVEIAKALSDAA
jgi:hypothetical protein